MISLIKVDDLIKSKEVKKSMTKRMVADCRKFPSEKNCDVYMSGSEEHVLEAAVQHAVGSHGHKDTPELRKQIREMMTEETAQV